jgi:hypothetical protein
MHKNITINTKHNSNYTVGGELGSFIIPTWKTRCLNLTLGWEVVGGKVMMMG